MPLTIPDCDSAREMWDVLERASFNTNLPLQLAGIDEIDIGSSFPDQRRVAMALRRTSEGCGLETLTRLFLIGVSVPVEAAERAVSPTNLDLWVRTGLLSRELDLVHAPVQLAPVQGKILAADRRQKAQIRPDHVLGYCGSAATLAKLTIRRKVRKMLDLGTGCGIQAILAASHADQAVGTDVNPRAVNMATFNAHLNGLSNVEVLAGDMFEPVLGRRFDLIVGNLPFVISPWGSAG
jgi:hypothetical protein